MHETKESLSILGLLIITGAAWGLGKLLVSDEQLTARLIIGRVLLGSCTSTVAGIGLIWIPDMHPLALLAVGSALGIAGATAVEAWLKKYMSSQLNQRRRATDKKETSE